MNRRLCNSLLAAIALLALALPAHASFENWKADQLTSTGSISDVAIVQGQRVFAGFELDSQNFTFTATLFTTSGAPGTQPVVPTDLGLVTDSSVSLSISNDGSMGYWATATEYLPNFETRSYIFASANLGAPTPVLGPGPTSDPNVVLSGINQYGTAVGQLAEAQPIAAVSNGFSVIIPYAHTAQLFGIDSASELLGGEAELSPGGIVAATLWDTLGNVIMQETAESRIFDVEGRYAVGRHNGFATYWKRDAGVYTRYHLEDTFGNPVQGELRTVDHGGSNIAGGTIVGDHAVVANLPIPGWFKLDGVLGLPAGTLAVVVGVDGSGDQLALAVEAVDFSGWDVTVTKLPGPGILVILPLLLLGVQRILRNPRT
jgi:hypothetical protein